MGNNLIDFWERKSNTKKTRRLCLPKFLMVTLLLLIGFFGNTSLYAQSVEVSGTVMDGNNFPIPGVSVLEKGTSNGTETDFDGKFTLNLKNQNAVLVFSSISHKTQEVSASGKRSFSIILEENLQTLDEVVVVGYGSSRKSDLTGSVVSIGGDALKTQPISNVSEALTGRLAGVQISSTEGSPDAEMTIRVRGNGSITQNASPLFIVDGFPVPTINDISSSDIESITVLKDASSTAIYGSRGANGVVIVTTKTGKQGRISIDVNSFYGFNKIAKTIDVLSPEDYVKWQYEYALLNNDEDSNGEIDMSSYEDFFGLWQDYDQYQGLKGNNWQEQIYGRRGEVQGRDLAIRGGNEKVSFNFNYAHFDQKAIMQGSSFRRDNLSLGLKSKLTDKLDLSLRFRYSDSNIGGGGANEQDGASVSRDSRLKHSVRYPSLPINGLTTEEAELSGDLINPFEAVRDNQRKQLRKNYNMQGSLSWKIIDNLKFKSQVGLNIRDDEDYRFYGPTTYYVTDRVETDYQGAPALRFRDRKRNSFRNANTLSYDFKQFLEEDHSLKLLLGEEMIIQKNNQLTNIIQGYPDYFDLDLAIKFNGQGDPFVVNNMFSPDDKLLSFFGRLNYDYKNRYLLTATYRMDGSSRFAGDNRWGYFPSVAFAWKASEEAFLEDVSWLDLLKFRLSYGQAGNNNIPTGQTEPVYLPNTTTYINNESSFWAPSTILANPDLKWETTVTKNAGLDFGFLSNRITGSFEVYENVTEDLLMNFPIAGSGYISQYRNVGEIQNSGVEASLNIIALEKENYGVNLGFNVGFNKNRINSLGTLEDFGIGSNWASTQIEAPDFLVEVGQPIGVMNGYLNDGRYEVSDFNFDSNTGDYTLKEGVVDASPVLGDLRPGMIKLKDIDGDNQVTLEDNGIIGDANPDFTGGFNLSAHAYGFDLSAAFNFSVGNDVYNANKIQFTTSNQNDDYANLSSIMADGKRWTNLNPETGQLVTDPAQLEALNANTTMWSPNMGSYVLSDWAVEDASFLRLNTLTLGYSIPGNWIEKAGLTRLRFYTTATNVFVLTNYSGLDPEVSTLRRTPLTPGVDYSPYPRSRQVVFGFNLSF